MDTIKLKVLKDYGKLSLDGYMYFRLTDWCGNILYDLRGWKENGTKPFDNEVKFAKEELEHLHSLLKLAINAAKPEIPLYVLKKGNRIVKVFNHFGELDCGIKMQFTYADWGYGSKYDIRYWEENFSDCWHGVRLSKEECINLIKILEKEFGFGK